MELVRELAEAGRRIRIAEGRRQRLPCLQGWIVAGPDISIFTDLLQEELNVESINTELDLEKFQQIKLNPNFRSLAPKARQNVNQIAGLIKSAENPEEMYDQIKAGGFMLMDVEITADDVEIIREQKEGYSAETITLGQGDEKVQVSLVLDMQDTPELLSKGLARDITRRVQAKRKELNLEIEDTIELTVQTKDAPELFKSDMEWIATETRASQALFDSEENISLDFDSFDVDGIKVSFHVKRA